MNLVVNARDALPHGGRIRIAVAHEHRSAETTPGPDVVRLTVSDNGTGMSPAVRARAFEPFFSTKGRRGSGLGLASAHGIVLQSNGEIAVDSTEGVGTTITMRFPAVEPAGVIERVEHGESRPGGAQTLLLVEDEDAVRRVLCAMLERGGFTVIAASSPLDACSMFEADADRVDMLITDVIMPGMNGSSLAKRLLALRPALPVLFISGHSDTESSLLGLDQPGIGFLRKPVRLDVLTTKIRELLHAARPPDRDGA
jgi:CheY-like chemotaxis protein/anti-sigma regulatory factor (Ser/Thr protein kinase)